MNIWLHIFAQKFSVLLVSLVSPKGEETLADYQYPLRAQSFPVQSALKNCGSDEREAEDRQLVIVHSCQDTASS